MCVSQIACFMSNSSPITFVPIGIGINDPWI